MNPKTVSILTQKGGVGKTTSAIHLSGTLSERGYKTLLIDFDTQINLSIGLGIKSSSYTVANFLKLDPNPQYIPRGINGNISILSGSQELNEKGLSLFSLKRAITKFCDDFDFVLIDCPPKPIGNELSFGEIAVTASDYIISPILADMYSIAGITTLINSISTLKQKEGLKAVLLGFFFNQVEERTNHFRGLYESLQNSAAQKYLFDSYIRKDINIIHAMAQGETVFELKPYCRAAQDLRRLTDEIITKIDHYEKSI